MTRRIIILVSAVVYLATIALTIASISIPEWISWDAYPEGQANQIQSRWQSIDLANKVHYSYGLHSKCDSVSQSCRTFPSFEECQGSNRKFCSLWRTTGFLMSMSVVVELAGLVGYAIVLLGGKQRRKRGWKMIVGIVSICAVAQAIAMAIVIDTHEKEARFFSGWYLGKSFVLSTVSWSLQAAIAIVITACAFALPDEDGYELIPDHNR